MAIPNNFWIFVFDRSELYNPLVIFRKSMNIDLSPFFIKSNWNQLVNFILLEKSWRQTLFVVANWPHTVISNHIQTALMLLMFNSVLHIIDLHLITGSILARRWGVVMSDYSTLSLYLADLLTSIYNYIIFGILSERAPRLWIWFFSAVSSMTDTLAVET